MIALERLKSIVDELSGSLEYLAYLEAAVDDAGFVVKHDGGSLGDSNFRLEPKLATDPCRCIECGGDQPEHSPECAYMAEIVGGVAQVYGVHLAVIGRRHFGNPIPQEWYAAARELLAAAPAVDVETLRALADRWANERGYTGSPVDDIRALIAASPKGGSDAPTYTTGHCENHKKPGGCPLHNLQCGYPQCDRRQAGDAEVQP